MDFPSNNKQRFKQPSAHIMMKLIDADGELWRRTKYEVSEEFKELREKLTKKQFSALVNTETVNRLKPTLMQ